MSTTEEMLSEQRAILEDVHRILAEHTKKLNMLSVAVLGNGNPGMSLFSKVQNNTTYLKLLGVAILAVPALISLIFAAIKLLTG